MKTIVRTTKKFAKKLINGNFLMTPTGMIPMHV